MTNHALQSAALCNRTANCAANCATHNTLVIVCNRQQNIITNNPVIDLHNVCEVKSCHCVVKFKSNAIYFSFIIHWSSFFLFQSQEKPFLWFLRFCLIHYLVCSNLYDFLRWFLFFLSYRGIAEVRLYAMMAAAFGILLASPVGEKAALRVLIQMSWLASHVTPDGSMKRWHFTASSNGNGVRGYDTLWPLGWNERSLPKMIYHFIILFLAWNP